MVKQNYSIRLHDAVENYYCYNPDTLMPMLMIALAAQGKLKLTYGNGHSETTAAMLIPEEIKDYDWVALNPSLKRKVAKWRKDQVGCVSVDMEIGRGLLPIFNIFKENDEVTVVMEYHHRIGRLIHHSGNEASEKAQREYATFVLAEALLDSPIKLLRECYFPIFNDMLEKSGLQPRRPRIDVARVLNSLLQYEEGKLVYNPFAGCSIAGAMLGSTNNYYGDGDRNDKIYAVGLLLNYGMGVSNEHFIQRDSTQWLQNKKIDYVISTYTGFVNGESAFDFCLGKCLNDEDFTGRYAGMVQPKEIFEKQTKNWKEALKRDWISAIVLMPFGEAAVLVDADKPISDKGTIKFINGTNPLACKTRLERLIADNRFAHVIKVNNTKKRDYLRSLVAPELQERKGRKKVQLKDLVNKIERKVYDLSRFDQEKRVLASIDPQSSYIGLPSEEDIERNTISSLFNPAYLLDEDCIIVNKVGNVEPRIFEANNGHAFFYDGYAFTMKDGVDVVWLQQELQESYVRLQLHPYGVNRMVPDMLTEEDYLNLTIYQAVEEEVAFDINDFDELFVDEEDEENNENEALPVGFVLKDGSKQYTILNFISHGAFGYTYRAEMTNIATGTREIVAIKEFYPKGIMENACCRVGNKVVCDECWQADYDRYKEMFVKEPTFIKALNDIKDNHVTEVKSIFESVETNTVYYVMKYYAGESLQDMINNNQVLSSEDLIVEKIVVPLCKALNAMHQHRILHLDIKPDNVVIDENGEAILIDFGVAQQYDENDKNTIERTTHSKGEFSAPENEEGRMTYFCPQSDIYSTAATLYKLFSFPWAKPMPVGGDVPWGIIWGSLNCSDEMRNAILSGMEKYVSDRPKDAQAFLSLFPGCKEIKL